MSIVVKVLVAMLFWAAFNVIERSLMLVTIFYFQQNVLKVSLQGRAIKSDNHYLATQITSFIVPYVHSLTNSVLDRQLNSGLGYPTIRVTSNRKRRRAVW